MSRRGFSKLLGGLLGSSVTTSTNREASPSQLKDVNQEYRIVSINEGFRELDSPYDVEVKLEYGMPEDENVEYSRFLFREEDLKDSDHRISDSLLEYTRKRNERISEDRIKLGRQIFNEHFDSGIAEDYFARRIGETIEIEKSLGIESITAFDKAMNQLNKCIGIEYTDSGKFRKNKFSQDIDEWMRTGW